MTVISISDEQFSDEVLKSNLPVLVDFWAEWCGPCKAIAPLIDQVADRFKNQLKVVKINVEENRSTASEFGIRGIPTLLLFQHGEMIADHVGAPSLEGLIEFIEKNTVEKDENK